MERQDSTVARDRLARKDKVERINVTEPYSCGFQRCA